MQPTHNANMMSVLLTILLLPSVDDTLEVSSLQRSATNQTTVDVGLCEQLRSVASLARTTIEDSGVVGNSLTVLLGDD